MIQAELRIAAGNKQGSSIALPQGKFLVGREEDCHLRPNSDLVSRHHCVFTVDDFSVRLRDLGSTNGTFVNGERLKGAVVLKQGDRVLIGKLDFEVLLQEGSSTLPASSVETVMIAGSQEAASASTQFAMPVLNLNSTVSQSEFLGAEAAIPEAAVTLPAPEMVPAGADTQMMPQQSGMLPPGYGMPVGYPQQQPFMQNPYGYPGYPPQMPQMQMPYYGQPMGYPQMQMPQQMMPPGYGMPQQGMMPQQMQPEPTPEAPAPASGGLGVKLPDPATSGAKAPPPPPAAAAAVPGAAPAVHIPTAAADIIKQYQTRR